MKKFFKVMFVAILAIAVAAPAMADIKVNGYYRTQFQADNVDNFGAKDGDTASEIDNRFRAKITNALTENVKLVYYLEVDTPWGQAGKAAEFGGTSKISGGGTNSMDGVNIETKNVYADFKINDVKFRVGGQGIGGRYENIIIGNDAMAAQVKFGNLNLLYSKLQENDKFAADDNDLYGINYNVPMGDNSKLQLDAYWFDNNDTFTFTNSALETSIALPIENNDIYYLGARYIGDLGGLKLDAWGIYNFGTLGKDDPATEIDLNAYAASVNAMFKAGAADASVRFTYLSGQDFTDTDATVFVSDLGGTFQMPKDNLMIFGTDLYYNNLGSQGVAWNAAKVWGMTALTAKLNMALPNDAYGKFGFGYFLLAEDRDMGTSEENELGMEVAATIGKKFAEKIDLQVRGAYATAGDALQTDGDDMFKTVLQLNVSY